MKMERLKELRQERGLSQAELAKAIDTAQPNIARWENGFNDPSSTQLVKLADYLNCTTDFLLGREDDFGIPETASREVKKAGFYRLFEKLSTDEQKTVETLMIVLINKQPLV